MANYLTMQDVVLGYMVTVILVELPDIKLQVKIKKNKTNSRKVPKCKTCARF